MKILTICILVLLSTSCNNRNEQKNSMSQQELNEHLTNANLLRVKKESVEIDEFIKRHQFVTQETGTGLRMQIYVKQKSGVKPVLHDEVDMICKVFLLDGTLCYESDTTSPIRFKLGEGMEARGVEEGIMNMLPGEQARLIIPNHLAYGLSGDGDKIPPAAALFIDLTLLKVRK